MAVPKDNTGSSTGTRSRVETLAQGLTLLLPFTESRDELSLKELAKITDLPKSTALRMLGTLEDFGFATRYDGL